ncbi:MAG: type II toxin-antitoxin system PemK/MazF family toxin [Candidatus Paceibacterota bacterium]
MNEPFDDWNELAKALDERLPIYSNTREIWWCSVGMNIGTEIYGKNNLFERPTLIVHLYNSETALILPITGKARNKRFFMPIRLNGKDCYVMLSQPRTISTKRLLKKEKRLPQEEFDVILKAFINLIMQNSAEMAESAEPEGLIPKV